MKHQLMAAKLSAWGFLDALCNGVVRFLLFFQFHAFCKAVTEVNPIFDKKGYNTWCSQAVSQPSTKQALRCLTSVIGQKPVYSKWFGCSRSL